MKPPSARRRPSTPVEEPGTEWLFSSLVAHLPGCVYRRGLGVQAGVDFLSASVSDLCGYPAADFVEGRRRLADLVLGADLPRIWRHIARATRHHRSYEVEFRVRHADGSERWLADRGQCVYDTVGRPAHFVGLLMDRTDAHEAQQEVARARAQFQSAIEALDVGFAMYDENDRMVVCNSTYRHALPLPPQEHPSLSDVLRALYRSGVEGIDRSLGEADWMAQRLQMHADLAQGPRVRELPVGDRWFRLDESRSPDGLTVVLRSDITASRRLTQELREARDAAEAASLAKTRFLANMSHELRTPLNAVIGAAQLLAAGTAVQGAAATDAQENLVEAIRKGGNSLLGLIENILDLTRIEAGAMSLMPEDFHLLDCMDAALATVAVAARAKGLALACVIDPQLPAWRHGDMLRLRQVVLNLLGNAVKFTHQGEVVLRIDRGADDDALHISVADTGVGIGEASLAHIFEPFRQGDEGADRRFGGSGLGLSIVRQLVEVMGGQIRVQSALGQGTRFDIDLRLPLVATPPPPPARLEVPMAYYEPHEASAQALAATLQRLGCTARRVHDSAQLRAWLAQAGRGSAQPPWLLVACDDLGALALLEGAAEQLDPERVIGMTQSESIDAERARETVKLPRNIVKPVLRAALVSRLGSRARALVEERSWHAEASDDAPMARSSQVLVVEDDALNQTIVCQLLSHAGFDSTAANDGTQALKLLSERSFDLVLMDWQMPDMDGLEVTRRIRAGRAGSAAQRVPIVALTANAFAEDRAACLAAGMDDFLTKPVLADRLVAAARRWTGRRTPVVEASPPSARAAPPASAPPCFDATVMARLPMVADGSDPRYPDRLLRIFIGAARRGLGEIESCLGIGDRDSLLRRVHTLKSSAAQVGALALSAHAARQEGLLRNGGEVGAADLALLQTALRDFEQATAALRPSTGAA